uniref:Gnk2-homologous domain-containing protein n=1 Tax=Opuntia streptacantha TaxID=393608 RepID=A0A7C8ZDC9_OPUST
MALLHHVVVVYVFSFIVTYSLAYDAEGSYCDFSSGIVSGGPVSTNIAHLLAGLIPKFEQGATFVESSYGKGKNLVYGLAQCRGDVDQRNCLGCIHDAAQEIQSSCTNLADARIWYDFCFIRYSQEQFYSKVDTSNGVLIGNQENVTDVKSFSTDLGKLFDKINADAIKPASGGFATGVKDISKFDTLYGMAQCTKDLSSLSCAQCLNTAIQNFQDFCSGRKGCRVMYSTCTIRYELYPFIFPTGSQKTPSESLTKVVVHY